MVQWLKRIGAREVPFIFACPALLWQVLFLALPLCGLLWFSVTEVDQVTGTLFWTLQHYRAILTPLYLRVIMRSFVFALWTSFTCFCMAYPVAYFLATKVHKKFKTLLLFLLILPSWTSLIVQIYAWFFLLQKHGWLSRVLCALGVIQQPVHFLNNYFAMFVCMTSCFLPFMVLPIFAVMEKIDKRLLEASADLGANRLQTFRHVVFPLSLPGVYAGCLLVFIPAFGEFAIPSLLGGSKYLFWGNVIVDKFLRSHDWRAGAAVAVVGIGFAVTIFALWFSIVRFVRWLFRIS